MADGSGPAKTSVGLAAEGGVFARGYDLAEDLIGKISFGSYFYLLVCGELPSLEQGKIVNALLVALGDPSLNSSHQAARIAYSSHPASLQLAMASGILAWHPKLNVEVESCAEFLRRMKKELYESDHSASHIIKERLKAMKEERGGVPGLGQDPRPTDPLAARLLAYAEEEKLAHTYVPLARQVHVEFGRVFDDRREIGFAFAMAALQLELDLPTQLTRYLPWLAEAGTMLAHIAEEHQRPIAPVLMSGGVRAVRFENRIEKD